MTTAIETATNSRGVWKNGRTCIAASFDADALPTAGMPILSGKSAREERAQESGRDRGHVEGVPSGEPVTRRRCRENASPECAGLAFTADREAWWVVVKVDAVDALCLRLVKGESTPLMAEYVNVKGEAMTRGWLGGLHLEPWETFTLDSAPA